VPVVRSNDIDGHVFEQASEQELTFGGQWHPRKRGFAQTEEGFQSQQRPGA